MGRGEHGEADSGLASGFILSLFLKKNSDLNPETILQFLVL